MIKIENVEVHGFETAIRGMRNPLNSWDKSDSLFCTSLACTDCPEYHEIECAGTEGLHMRIGKNDLDLMKRLFKGGTEHRKYLRFINVTMDITAPLYWWKEFDTYKVGTNCNSCSTMHKIHAKEFSKADFSYEHMSWDSIKILDSIVAELNKNRTHFLNLGERLKEKDLDEDERNDIIAGRKHCWWQMIQLLPTSYNQRRTIQMNYEVAVRMIQQRTGHKLDEWHVLVEELLKLPYMKEIMGLEN